MCLVLGPKCPVRGLGWLQSAHCPVGWLQPCLCGKVLCREKCVAATLLLVNLFGNLLIVGYLQDADCVVSLTLELGKTGDLRWVGKTLDLSKACKQLPILPGHRDLAVTFFRDRHGKSRYYIPNAFMFGLQQCMPLIGL